MSKFRNSLEEKGLVAKQTPNVDNLLGVPVAVDSETVLLPCSKLLILDNQPFKLHNDEQLKILAEAIKRSGLLSAVIVRPVDKGNYEVLSGRNRVRAVVLNGDNEIKAIIRDVDDDEAESIMIDDNFGQRPIQYPSEKAKVFLREVEKLNRQGKRSDLTLSQNDTKLDAYAKVGEKYSESRATISRYIRLNYLIPKLLSLVDENKLNFVTGVELSHVDEGNQRLLLEKYISKGVKPSKEQITELKSLSKDGRLDEQAMAAVMEKAKEIKLPTVYKINRSKLSEFSDILDNQDKLEILFIEFLRSYKQIRQGG